MSDARLTDEQLQTIKRSVQAVENYDFRVDRDTYLDVVPALLREVERLRAERDEWRTFAQIFRGWIPDGEDE